MRQYDTTKHENMVAIAESQAGEAIAGMASAVFDSTSAHTEAVLELASGIADGDVGLVDLSNDLSTPGERQDFYFAILKAAYLKKLKAQADNDTEEVEDVVPAPKTVGKSDRPRHR